MQRQEVKIGPNTSHQIYNNNLWCVDWDCTQKGVMASKI